MATTAKSTSTKTAKARRTRRTGRRDPLAVSLLKKDHREVEGWFDEYEQLEDEGDKLALFNQIALALKVHTTIEEEIFYPEERGDVEDDMLDEAYVEHDGAKKLIAEIEAMKPSDEYYDAKDIAAGPVCRILLPHRISSGTHACWAGRDQLAG